MSKKYYIYKMYNNKDELLYIGKTHNLYARMNAHFSNSQLKDQEWKLKVNKIEVIELYNQYDIDIIEIYILLEKRNQNIIQIKYTRTYHLLLILIIK